MADTLDAASMLRLLAIDIETLFVLSETGRIVCENDPERSPGPRLFFAGCAGGNHVRVHQAVRDDVAAHAIEMLAGGPPWLDPLRLPVCWPAVTASLDRDAPVAPAQHSVIYRLPRAARLPRASAAAVSLELVCSGTARGDRFLGALRRSGIPRHMAAAGFASVSEVWPPWCVALDGQTIAAVALTARRGARGAEAGVYSFPGWRSRGLAAAVTAQWSTLPELAGLELFYSTLLENRSSRRVAERLRLDPFAVALTLS